MPVQWATASALRAPALRVFANGTLVGGALSADISTVGYHSADRFRVAAALAAVDAAWFAAQSNVMIDVQIGLDGGWVTLAHGLVDSVSIDPIEGLLHLDGRDLTASLIAARTSETFANRTASEIVQLLAGRHNLTASVTPTSRPVGRYYDSEHDRSTLHQFARVTTEWDLLVFLALQEGYVVYVEGTNLHFHPAFATASANWLLRPVDCVALRLDRALTLAADVEVVVRSWSSRQQAGCVQSATANGGAGGGTAQQYVFVRPNLTPDQALQFAQSMLADLTQHERTVSATIPGELAMTPRDMVTLQGSGTAFDQSYRIMRIDRSISAQHGFVQHLQAKSATGSPD